MNFFYNPLDLRCKSVIGAVRKNEKLNINVLTGGEGERCTLLLRRDGENETLAFPMRKTQSGFFVPLESLAVGLYWYYFECDGIYYGAGESHYSECGRFNFYQLTVYAEDYKTPDWLKGGVIYQIFPDRFNRSGDFKVPVGKVARKDWGGEPTYRNADGKVLNNEFFGGNFKGIEEKLEYLKELGVTCVYLNPISEAYSSHRYDTADYTFFDSVLGTEDELKSLIEKAAKLGIVFVFDGVFNHVGADSVYFNKYGNYRAIGAYNDKTSPYYGWFSFENYPDEYACWWNFETLPSIRKDCKDYQNFICDKVIAKYMKLGFKGVRLDVVDELETDFVKAVRKAVKSFGDGVVIGEVWEDPTNKIAYGERRSYFQGGELDSVMNYPLKNAIVGYLLSGNAELIKRTVEEQINNFPKCALDALMNVLSTHDSVRIITELGRNEVVTDKDAMKYEIFTPTELEKGVRLSKLAYVLAFTLYGVPSVYYGDEAGLYGNLDPYNRRCYPWGRENEDMLAHIKKLSEIRKDEVFKEGATRVLYAEQGIFIFERRSPKALIAVAVSRREQDAFLSFPLPAKELLSGETTDGKFLLRSGSAAIFKFK